MLSCSCPACIFQPSFLVQGAQVHNRPHTRSGWQQSFLSAVIAAKVERLSRLPTRFLAALLPPLAALLRGLPDKARTTAGEARKCWNSRSCRAVILQKTTCAGTVQKDKVCIDLDEMVRWSKKCWRLHICMAVILQKTTCAGTGQTDNVCIDPEERARGSRKWWKLHICRACHLAEDLLCR